MSKVKKFEQTKKEFEEIHTEVHDGVRIGVNDFEPPKPVEKTMKKVLVPKPKPIDAESCSFCSNIVLEGKCTTKDCQFNKPRKEILVLTGTSTTRKSMYPPKKKN